MKLKPAAEANAPVLGVFSAAGAAKEKVAADGGAVPKPEGGFAADALPKPRAC